MKKIRAVWVVFARKSKYFSPSSQGLAPLIELGGHSLLDLVWRCEYLECSPERDVGIRDHLSARVGISVFYRFNM